MAVDARAAWTRARVRTLPALALAPAIAGCASSSPAGNGVASKSPARIVAIATAAATAAESVHVEGSILSEGKPISLNMELDAEKGGQGQVTLGDLSIDLVNVDRAVYVKAGSAFYSRFAGPAAARVLQGKWLRGSDVSGPLASFTSLTELRKLLQHARWPRRAIPQRHHDRQRAEGRRCYRRSRRRHVVRREHRYSLPAGDRQTGSRRWQARL